MKRFVLIVILIFALTTSAASAAVATNVIVPIVGTVSVPCANGGAGEDVTLSGPLHILQLVTISGSHVLFKEQANPQDVFGVGSVSRALYKATGITESTANFHVSASFPLEETFVNNFRIIGKGLTSNLLLHETFHATINANGTVSTVLDHITADCRTP